MQEACALNTLPDGVETVLRNLQRNNMTALYLPRREGVPQAIAALLRPGAAIALGGSATLEECGVLELGAAPATG